MCNYITGYFHTQKKTNKIAGFTSLLPQGTDALAR